MTIINSVGELEASFGELYNQLIETAFKNYKTGAIKPCAMTQRDGDKINQLISYELFNLIDQRFSVKEKFLLNRINQARSQALNAARQGDIVTAEQLMEKVRTTWDVNQVSAEVNLLYKSFQAAAEAYLDYRRGDFDIAWSHITEAIITDAVLETEYGYKVLFAHRLHLVQNLVRSEARGERVEKAVKLGSQLLAYLEGKSENLPFPVSWDINLIASSPPEVISTTFTLVTNEIALILTAKNRQKGQELWEIIAEHINLEIDDGVETNTPAYAWLRMKQAFFKSNLAHAIELMSQFLAAGRSKVPLLWYATVIDLVEICNQLRLPNAAVIKQQIADDAVHWEDFPKQFLSLLNN